MHLMASILKDSKAKDIVSGAVTLNGDCMEEDVKAGMIRALAILVPMVLLLLELKTRLES